MAAPLPRIHCLRCHHTWVPRKDGSPKQCPGCTSPLWNTEYQRQSALTKDVLDKIRGCPTRICQLRYARLSQQGNEDGKSGSAPRVKIPYRAIRVKEITRDNLPEGFRRIGRDQCE